MLRNGSLHRVCCDWCGLKLACHCFLAETLHHVPVLCPTCQVTEVVNEMFGTKNRRVVPLDEDAAENKSVVACKQSERTEGDR